MTNGVLIRRNLHDSVAAETSHGAEWGARPFTAPLNAMGANVTIQKNWQELIRPNKLQVSVGADPKREATVVAEPLERGFGVTLGNALRRGLLFSLPGGAGATLFQFSRGARISLGPRARRRHAHILH